MRPFARHIRPYNRGREPSAPRPVFGMPDQLTSDAAAPHLLGNHQSANLGPSFNLQVARLHDMNPCNYLPSDASNINDMVPSLAKILNSPPHLVRRY